MFSMLSALALSILAANPYDRYYEGLPIELARVQPVTFPDTRLNLSDLCAEMGISPTGLVTEAVQAGIDRLAAQGGGHLDIPAGEWEVSPIEMRSNVDLHFMDGAVFRFSKNRSLYLSPVRKDGTRGRNRPCISIQKCTNVGITGHGTIDGNGFYWRYLKWKKTVKGGAPEVWEAAKAMGGTLVPKNNGKDTTWYPFNLKPEVGCPNFADSYEEQERLRYSLIKVIDTENLLVQDVKITNSPQFHFAHNNTRNLIVDHVTVWCEWWAQNGDAMDFGNVKTALIVGCKVNAGDDGICLKGGGGQKGYDAGPCQDVLILQDTVYHAHGAFVFGSDCAGGLDRVVCKNCVFDGTDVGIRMKSAPGKGGSCREVYCEDIVMRNIPQAAILFECGYAGEKVADDKDLPFCPDWGNFVFRRIDIDGAQHLLKAEGLPHHWVHDLVFEDVTARRIKKETLWLNYCRNFRFEHCSVAGEFTADYSNITSQGIVWNGKKVTLDL